MATDNRLEVAWAEIGQKKQMVAACIAARQPCSESTHREAIDYLLSEVERLNKIVASMAQGVVAMADAKRECFTVAEALDWNLPDRKAKQ